MIQPNIRSTTLANGLRIITERVSHTNSFSLGAAFLTGSSEETEFPHGTTHFLEHAVFRRTKHATSKQIANNFESIGAYINAFTSKEMTLFYVRALIENFDKSLKQLLELCFEPEFRKNEIDKEREIIREEIVSTDDDAEELIFDQADALLFNGSGYAHPIAGTVESLDSIDEKTLKKYHSRYFTPSNLIISFVGDIEHDRIVELIEKSAGRRKGPDKAAPKHTFKDMRKDITEGKSFQQSHLVSGYRFGRLSEREKETMILLNILLGDSMSSRLYQALREKLGYVYSIYSTISFYKGFGAFYVYSAFDKKKTERIKAEIVSEINRLSLKGPGVAEFKRAKEQYRSQFQIELEGLTARMRYNLRKAGEGKMPDPVSKLALVKSIEAGEIRETIIKTRMTEKMRSVIFLN